MTRLQRWLTGAGLALALLASDKAAVADDFAEAYRAELYAGRFAAAGQVAGGAIATDPAKAHAAQGVATFFGAVEGLIHGFHRYGLNNGTNGFGAMALAGMPFLRLPVAPNPNPEPVSYQGLRQLLAEFHSGLAQAEAELAKAGDAPFTLELDLGQVALDLNADGTPDPGATLLTVFQAVSGARTEKQLVVDFDQSDASWLQAYAHLLMAMADMILAHDWQAAYDATFEGLFPQSFTPKTALNSLYQDFRAKRERFQAEKPPRPACKRWIDGKPNEPCTEEWTDYNAHPAVMGERQLRQAAEYGSIADLIAFVHLLRWDVVEPQRLKDAHGHLLSMVALSRETWRRIGLETDNGREWLPGPNQTGIFPTMPIDQRRMTAWLGFLDSFEAVLKGEMLLPHWRFEQGFNLRRMFEEPGQLDLVMMLHGAGVLPYLEDGPIADSGVWSRTVDVFGGDFFRYFVWIN